MGPNNSAEHALVSFICCGPQKKQRHPNNSAEHALVSFLCCGLKKRKSILRSPMSPLEIVPENIASDTRALQMPGVCANMVRVSKVVSEGDELADAQQQLKPASHRRLNANIVYVTGNMPDHISGRQASRAFCICVRVFQVQKMMNEFDEFEKESAQIRSRARVKCTCFWLESIYWAIRWSVSKVEPERDRQSFQSRSVPAYAASTQVNKALDEVDVEMETEEASSYFIFQLDTIMECTEARNVCNRGG